MDFPRTSGRDGVVTQPLMLSDNDMAKISEFMLCANWKSYSHRAAGEPTVQVLLRAGF
jgi:hypothetical protein